MLAYRYPARDRGRGVPKAPDHGASAVAFRTFEVRKAGGERDSASADLSGRVP